MDERQVLKLLVVDDNRDAADTLAAWLQLYQCNVEVAYSGEEALDKAQVQRPNVVLLDIGLPGMDGYETCRRLRQEPWARDIPIVAITGWGNAEDRRKSREAGFTEHFTKPVSHEVISVIATAIDPA